MPWLLTVAVTLLAFNHLPQIAAAGDSGGEQSDKTNAEPPSETASNVAEVSGQEVQRAPESCPGFENCALAKAQAGPVERAIVAARAVLVEEQMQKQQDGGLIAGDCEGEDCRLIAQTTDQRGEVAVPPTYQFVLQNQPYLCTDTLDGDCSNTQGGLVPEVDQRSVMMSNVLDLHDMELTGTIPAAGLALVSDITSLDLSMNYLEGSIPDAIGLLTELRRVRLSRNQLTGWIPMAFGFLTDLLYFDLSTNQLSGSIPLIFGQMHNLITLNVGSNKLQGSIPDAMFTPWIFLSEFETLDYENSEIERLTSGETRLGLPHDKVLLLGGTELLTDSSGKAASIANDASTSAGAIEGGGSSGDDQEESSSRSSRGGDAEGASAP